MVSILIAVAAVALALFVPLYFVFVQSYGHGARTALRAAGVTVFPSASLGAVWEFGRPFVEVYLGVVAIVAVLLVVQAVYRPINGGSA